MSISKRIQAARKHIKECEESLESAREHVKDCRKSLKAAISGLYRDIDSETNGVQDLPFEDDGEPSADHEEDEPDYHGEPVAELEALADEGLIKRMIATKPLNRKGKA